MSNQDPQPLVAAPSLPKGGGAIQSIGKGWGAVGATGGASFDIALPITQGRGYAPGLVLSYQSSVGNGLFGLGWNLNLGCVARRASKGVPNYTDEDVILGPGGDIWLPERDADGVIRFDSVSDYKGHSLGETYQVIRYFARIEGAFERIEHWRLDVIDPGFWVVHGADGGLAIYGKKPSSRSTDPADSNHVAEWLLEETMNVQGEHILYEYKAEDEDGLPADHPRDFIAQCYLWRVRYGNFQAHPVFYLWDETSLDDVQWHFDLLFDYGERDVATDGPPPYAERHSWALRSDSHSSFAYGFELGNLRLVHAVLMFHHFADEFEQDEPVFVAGLKLEYLDFELNYKMLSAVQSMAYSPNFQDFGLQLRPAVTFAYQDFDLAQGGFSTFDAMPGLDDGQRYQLVDLFGDGVPGVLYRSDKAWCYREPLRGDSDADAIVYGPWQTLPSIPVADSRTGVQQFLADMTGDGRPDWVVAQPGMAGFFTLNPDRSVSGYVPFSAFPAEFFNPHSQMVDLVGAGLSDLALIGPRSVRLYANRRAEGYAPGVDVPHDEDVLPLLSDSPTELVAFSDILGTGQQHLVRIRHNEVCFWPNLGRGRFGKRQVFASLPFEYTRFDAARVRLADMDGSGAVDLVYLQADGFQIFMNQAGNGFAPPVLQPWPEGVRYDRFCQVSVADLQGLGCSSLVLTVPHMSPAHWRFDYPAIKPYLLQATCNNIGASGTVTYRSSAQEWLDEKHERPGAVSGLPFAMHVVKRQTQLDEVTENQLIQRLSYRGGYYDRHDREFRGFGLVMQTDSESGSSDGFTAPLLSKSWFNTGAYPPQPAYGFNSSDSGAVVLGKDMLSVFVDGRDEVIDPADDSDMREMARTLAGTQMRAEVFGLDDEGRPFDVPYSIQSSRYLVRRLAVAGAHQPYARMLPLALESVRYQYETRADDPMCVHEVNLSWDAFGVLTHGVSVNCSRRKKASDTPPFGEEHQDRWWQAAHDDAQQRYYFNEGRAQAIHLDSAQSWRLALPYRARANAMTVDAGELTPDEISYERFSEPLGFFASLPRTLVGLSVQRYQNAGEGEATFEALPDALESAELDDHALTAYDRLTESQLGAALEDKLREVGYQQMPGFLPEDGLNLWSVRRGFNTYADADKFYRIETFKPTSSHGLTRVEYDPYSLMVAAVTAPDGCITSAAYDYYRLLPCRVVDPNQNVQEAFYDGFGTLTMSSFYGTERGEEIGFASLAGEKIFTLKPWEAITASPSISYASAHYYDAFSWMNDRQPVHAIDLQWDRYPGDEQRQQRMVMTSVDGFGRTLQTRQKVEAGDAYEVIDGELRYLGDELIVSPADDRWRVSERVEYNNKGLAVRVYRPYFTNSHEYVNDSSVRARWHHDKQYYDPLGRPTITRTAKGWMRRLTYHAWYTVNEDENDTWEEVEEMRLGGADRD